MLAYGATRLCYMWERNNSDETCPKVSPSRARSEGTQEIEQQLAEFTENKELDELDALEDYEEYVEWLYADYEDIDQYLNQYKQLYFNIFNLKLFLLK